MKQTEHSNRTKCWMTKLTRIICVSCTVSVPPPVRVKIFCEVVCVLPIWRSSVGLLNFLQIQAFEHNCKQLSTPSPSLFTWAWYIFRQNMDHLAFKPFQIPVWGTFCKQMVCGGIYFCLLLFYWLSRSMTYLGKVKKSQRVLLSLREHAFPFGKSLSVSTKSTYFGQEEHYKRRVSMALVMKMMCFKICHFQINKMGISYYVLLYSIWKFQFYRPLRTKTNTILTQSEKGM